MIHVAFAHTHEEEEEEEKKRRSQIKGPDSVCEYIIKQYKILMTFTLRTSNHAVCVVSSFHRLTSGKRIVTRTVSRGLLYC